jgi:CheY-like chemotaxis protein
MANRRTIRVLVVDDELELRHLVSDVLGTLDVTVCTAGSGKEALEIARAQTPDLLITDLRLGDCTGLDLIDDVRKLAGEVPAVVITGYGDPESLAAASRRRPVELMTKPLDVDRLRRCVQGELNRLDRAERLDRRNRRLRMIARNLSRDRNLVRGQLDSTCADLTCAYRSLNNQFSMQQTVINYQNSMIAAHNDDEVFAAMFRAFATRTGPLFGVSLVCDENAKLNIIGRFGMPKPDELGFCQKLIGPIVDKILATPSCMIIDAWDEVDLFAPAIHRRLCGVSILVVPLIPAPGELIGMGVLYRKGEQPFTEQDIALADMISQATATAVRRND